MIAANPTLDGPCFQPDFIGGLAKYIDGCRIALLGDSAKPDAFWPFCLDGRGNVALPIPMCDYQAIIGAPTAQWDIRGLLGAAGLKAWRFENLIASQIPTDDSRRLHRSRSPRVVLPRGFDAYLEEQTQAGKSSKNIRNKLRLLNRDHGAVTFTQVTRDNGELDRLLKWKSDKFGQGQAYPASVVATLRHFLDLQEGSVVGVLSMLKAGDSLVAVHFGVKVGSLLYYWFPGFDPAFSKYTPGWLLVWHLLKHLPDTGCDVMDFGPGGEGYKEYFANEFLDVGTGIVEASALRASINRGLDRSEAAIRRIAKCTPGVRRGVLATREFLRRIAKPSG